MKIWKILGIMALIGTLVVPISAVVMGDTEPNNDPNNAESVSKGTYTGTLSPTDQKDVYSTPVTEDEEVKIQINAVGGEVFLVAFGKNSGSLGEQTNSGTSFSVTYYSMKDDTLLIMIYPKSGQNITTITYTLTISDKNSGTSDTSNGSSTCSSAILISIPIALGIAIKAKKQF